MTFLVEKITDDTPDNIRFTYGFILWICLPLIGLIPAFLVKEDLKRLNMKEVQNSEYIEETTILALNNQQEKLNFIREHKIIANDDVLELYELVLNRNTAPVEHQSEPLISEEEQRRITNRISDQSVANSSISVISRAEENKFEETKRTGKTIKKKLTLEPKSGLRFGRRISSDEEEKEEE